MSKLHNGIEYKGGEKVYVTGNASLNGQMVGTVVGFTKGGQFRVKIDEGYPRAGEVVRSHWVSLKV